VLGDVWVTPPTIVTQNLNFKRRGKMQEVRNLEELLQEIAEFGEWLEKRGVLSEGDFFILENVAVGYAGSKLGYFIHPKYLTAYGRLELLTANKEDFGKDFCYHGDYMAHYWWASRECHREVWKHRKEILEAIEEHKKRIEAEDAEMGI